MSATRLSIAAHPDFPGGLLDGAMPNGGGDVLVASGMTSFDQALMAAERDNSQVLLAFTPTVADVVGLLAQSRETRPDMGVVVALPGPANGSLGAALAAGAHEIVILPAERSVVAAAVHKAVARVSTARSAEAAAAVRAPLVVVLGPKGGVGKTTVATNLATSLARAGNRTLLIDLDFEFGDVGLVLGLAPDRTIHDLAVSRGHLDGERLRGFLARSADGVDVLMAPIRPDQADAITSEVVTAVLDVAASEFDVVVVDTPPAFSPATITVIDRAEHAIVLGSVDLPGLKNMRIGLETLDLMGFPRNHVLSVINRAGSKVGLLAHEITQVLSAAPDMGIPSDRAVPRSTNAARPIVVSDPKSAPAKALAGLAKRVASAVIPVNAKEA
jgi:pilus assembly protein CpaE